MAAFFEKILALAAKLTVRMFYPEVGKALDDLENVYASALETGSLNFHIVHTMKRLRHNIPQDVDLIKKVQWYEEVKKLQYQLEQWESTKNSTCFMLTSRFLDHSSSAHRVSYVSKKTFEASV
ncbi:hypothetical protein VNI00_019191 [Paramarasmius palmivorus]|uniref:Uncharacterized protein n=1 Tax=Paramarasmius palmivorus TaxID=297713 RepID=A0AAW0AQW7_9AGAR